jgi:hypothetical protein
MRPSQKLSTKQALNMGLGKVIGRFLRSREATATHYYDSRFYELKVGKRVGQIPEHFKFYRRGKRA